MLDRRKEIPVQSITDISFGNVSKMRLPNGIPLVVCRSGREDVVRMDLMFDGGKWQQEHLLQALFANRMLREGTASMSGADISENMDFCGSWLELGVSMLHSFVTSYSLGRYFARTAAIVEDMVKSPSFDEERLRTIAQINKQNYMVTSRKVDFAAQKNILKALFGEDNPAAKYAVPDDFDALDRDLLADFHRRYYQSDNCHLFLAGNVTDEVLGMVERLFGSERFGENLHRCEVRSYPVNRPDERLFTFEEKTNAVQSSLRMASFIPERKDKDFSKVQILVSLFGGYFGSRLMSNIRERKGYTYGISAGMVFYPGVGAMLVSTEADAKYCRDIIDETKREMDRLCTEPVGQEELDNVKNYMAGELARSFEGAFSVVDSQIFLVSSGLTEQFYGNTVKTLREITPDDIREMAVKYFSSSKLKISLAGKTNI